MLKFLVLTFLLINTILSAETTHDPEFEKQFQVTHIKEGDGKTFPKKEIMFSFIIQELY